MSSARVDPAGGAVAVERGDELEVAPAAHVRIEARRLDEPGDAVERAHAVDQRVAPEQLDRALVGPDQPEQHPHRRRLARAVGPEVAVDVTAADRQVDVVDRGDPAVALDQAARLDRRRARVRRAPHRRPRAAFSAATGGTEPATTYDTPPRSNWTTVPERRRELRAGRAVDVDLAAAGSPRRRLTAAAPSAFVAAFAADLVLEDDDRAEALAVHDERALVPSTSTRCTPWRGSPASLSGAASAKSSCLASAATLVVAGASPPWARFFGVAGVALGGLGAERHDLGAGGHRRPHGVVGDRAVGDLGRLELEHGVRLRPARRPRRAAARR